MSGVLAVTIFGGPFLRAVLGAKYAAAVPLLAWLPYRRRSRGFCRRADFGKKAEELHSDAVDPADAAGFRGLETLRLVGLGRT